RERGVARGIAEGKNRDRGRACSGADQPPDDRGRECATDSERQYPSPRPRLRRNEGRRDWSGPRRGRNKRRLSRANGLDTRVGLRRRRRVILPQQPTPGALRHLRRRSSRQPTQAQALALDPALELRGSIVDEKAGEEVTAIELERSCRFPSVTRLLERERVKPQRRWLEADFFVTVTI